MEGPERGFSCCILERKGEDGLSFVRWRQATSDRRALHPGLNGVDSFLPFSLSLSLFLLSCLFMATPAAYRGSQARGLIGAIATGLRHSHSNAVVRAASATYTTAHGNVGSLTHGAKPGVKPASSWILVRFVSAVPGQECQVSGFHSLQFGADPFTKLHVLYMDSPVSWDHSLNVHSGPEKIPKHFCLCLYASKGFFPHGHHQLWDPVSTWAVVIIFF